jgi:hypothetical protein
MSREFGKNNILLRWPDWMKLPWWRVAYLIPPFLRKDLSELVQIPVGEKFQNVIEEHTKAFIEKGVEPPREIAGVIYNIADDLQHGREAILRAGDYIAVQSFIKRK